jgi:hypothetical protein
MLDHDIVDRVYSSALPHHGNCFTYLSQSDPILVLVVCQIYEAVILYLLVFLEDSQQLRFALFLYHLIKLNQKAEFSKSLAPIKPSHEHLRLNKLDPIHADSEKFQNWRCFYSGKEDKHLSC